MLVKYKDVELLAIEPISFTDKEGVEVEYNKCYFGYKNEDGITHVLQLNSKLPLASSERERGILAVEIDETGRNKPKVVSFEVE